MAGTYRARPEPIRKPVFICGSRAKARRRCQAPPRKTQGSDAIVWAGMRFASRSDQYTTRGSPDAPLGSGAGRGNGAGDRLGAGLATRAE